MLLCLWTAVLIHRHLGEQARRAASTGWGDPEGGGSRAADVPSAHENATEDDARDALRAPGARCRHAQRVLRQPGLHGTQQRRPAPRGFRYSTRHPLAVEADVNLLASRGRAPDTRTPWRRLQHCIVAEHVGEEHGQRHSESTRQNAVGCPPNDLQTGAC